MRQTIEILCQAKTLKKCVRIYYDGHVRTVEVHIVGRHKNAGNQLLRGFQVFGGSNSNQQTGWKLFYIRGISHCFITNLDSKAPRPQYNPNDPAMAGGIWCRI